MVKVLLNISVLLALGVSCLAQDKNINTERLNLDNTTQLIEKGAWQAEAGFRFQSTSIQYFRKQKLQSPTVMQRYGLSKRIELRLQTTISSNFAINKGALTTNYNVDGLEAPQLGAKFKLKKQKRFLPEIAAIAEVNIPHLASLVYRNDNWLPQIRLLLSHQISDNFRLGYNVGGFYSDKFNLTYDVYVQKKWGQFLMTNVEYFGTYSKPDEMKPYKQQYLFAALAYYIDHNVLADVGLGRGMGNSPDYFFKVGLSFLLKK